MTQPKVEGFQTDISIDELTSLDIVGNKQLTFDNLYFYEGNGNVSAGSDIRGAAQILLSSGHAFHIHFDNNDDGFGTFIVSKGSQDTGGSETQLFRVENSGRIKSAITNYETLIDHDDVLTNKKYVDDLAGGLGFGQTYQSFTPGGNRQRGVTYTNSTGNAIALLIHIADAGAGNVWLYINGTIMRVESGGFAIEGFFVVPVGGTFMWTTTGAGVPVTNYWWELR